MELRTDHYFAGRTVGEDRTVDFDKLGGFVCTVPITVTYPQSIHMVPAIVAITRSSLTITFNGQTKEMQWHELISKVM